MVKAKPKLDLPALLERCEQSGLTSVDFYELYKSIGIEYGPGHQGIEGIYLGTDQVLAKLSLPASVFATLDDFLLHPSMLDAAIQASLGFLLGENPHNRGKKTPPKPALPFALQELDIFGECASVMWAVLKPDARSKARDKVQKINIDLCDQQGNIRIRMKGLSSRVLEEKLASPDAPFSPEILLAEPVWREREVNREAARINYAQHVIMFSEHCGFAENLQEGMERELREIAAKCRKGLLRTSQKEIALWYQAYTIQVFEEVQRILQASLQGKVLFQVVIHSQGEEQLLGGLAGILKTANLENPKLIGQLIEVSFENDLKDITAKLKENSRRPTDNHICYQEGKRLVLEWDEITVGQKSDNIIRNSIPWKDGGTYLLTGGSGGLGLIFAREIAQKAKNVKLILAGRSGFSQKLNQKLAEVFQEAITSGVQIEYRQADVTKKRETTDLFRSIQEEFGDLTGIIHGAGLIQDNFLLKKTRQELEEVLAPKVMGLVNLDLASCDMALDFFLVFSSLAGALGNIGQADYSAANAFMDRYTRYRNTLVAAKKRQGRTLSISWPLWKDGGMTVDKETKKKLKDVGMVPLRTSSGIQALYQCFDSGREQVMVLEGDPKRLRKLILSRQKEKRKEIQHNQREEKQLEEDFYLELSEKIKNGDLSEEELVNIWYSMIRGQNG